MKTTLLWSILIWTLLPAAGFDGALAFPREEFVCSARDDWSTDPDECPNEQDWVPSPEQLKNILTAHRIWTQGADPAIPGRAILCNAYLRGVDFREANLDNANLRGAFLSEASLRHAKLSFANLEGAILVEADLRSAVLEHASLQCAVLRKADLSGANLKDAALEDADLSKARVEGARIAFAGLAGSLYDPDSPPPDSYLVGLQGLASVEFPRGRQSGLVQLRELLQKAGLRDLEREATFAIEHGKALNARNSESALERLGGWARLILFEWTTGWGLGQSGRCS